jgi:hypothetical protein
MRGQSRVPLVCTECDGGMERIEGVPVLTSLVGHAVHQCGACGHILLVREGNAPGWSPGWVSLGAADISCVSPG